MIKRLALTLAVVAGLFVAASSAQEAVTLTTPIVATTAALHVGYIGIDLDGGRIIAQVENASGTVVAVKTYDGTTTPSGATLLNQINRGNFTANSLLKAVYNRLIADGVIPAGSITGTPQ